MKDQIARYFLKFFSLLWQCSPDYDKISLYRMQEVYAYEM